VPDAQGGLGRLPFMLILAGVLVAGLVGLLMLQTRVQEQSFEVRQLQTKATELSYRQAQLEAQVQQKATPAEIARQATALGMVPNPYAVYIDVRTGTVVGTPEGRQGQRGAVHHVQVARAEGGGRRGRLADAGPGTTW
jgi:outer membrane murein-binding lipoprotein Lpp